VGFTTLYIEGGQSLNFAMPVEWAGEIQSGKKAVQGSSTKPAQERSWVDWEKRTIALQAAKNWTVMRDWTQRWTKAEPEDSYAWSRLGDAYTELKRYPEAVEAYRQSVRINPADANARAILALAYAQAGDRTAALEALKQLRRLDPAEADKLVRFLEKFALENINAAAGWVIVGSDKTNTQYANPSTIRRKGNIVTMWDLLDYNKARVLNKSIKPFMSMKNQEEYDCEEERMRTLSSSLHSGKMGKGNVVFSDSDPSQWISIPPQSRGENLWEVACGKGR
jgi:tetratricopeptide (TPR) repeat protein